MIRLTIFLLAFQVAIGFQLSPIASNSIIKIQYNQNNHITWNDKSTTTTTNPLLISSNLYHYERSYSFAPLAMSASGEGDQSEIIAARIKVKGDVGGYYRACVLNEAGKFRRLTGTMSPPSDDSDEAEIYVEGKRKMVDGFLRWLKRSNVGLSQKIEVTDVTNEEPLGVYEEFYCKTK